MKRLGTDYVDLYQIHRWDYQTPIEETMEALHDVVRAGKARYIGASAMFAWQFQKALHVAEKYGWTRFVAMEDHLNLLYREEEREMLPLCREEKIGVIPYSPLASGRLTRDWSSETTLRSETDQIAKGKYDATAETDRQVVERVAEIAEKHGVPRVHIALAWLLQKKPVAAPIIGATKMPSSVISEKEIIGRATLWRFFAGGGFDKIAGNARVYQRHAIWTRGFPSRLNASARSLRRRGPCNFQSVMRLEDVE